MLFTFNMVWPCIYYGTVFVCPQLPYRDSEMIFSLDFTTCLRSRFLHVALANPQTFGCEFYLMSLPCEFSRQSVHKSVVLIFLLQTLLTRPNQVETAVHNAAILGFQFRFHHVIAL